VLYRINAQSRLLEEALIRAGIPYHIYSGVKFYERKEIKDILAYLRILFNPADTVSFRRVANVPRRGLGADTVEKVLLYAEEQNMPVMAALTEASYIPGLRAQAIAAVSLFAELIRSILRDWAGGVADLARLALSRTGYMEQWGNDHSQEAEARIENINEFISLTAEYDESEPEEPVLGGFLAQVALVAEIDALNEAENAVKLMTMHSAKGLEFPVVFNVGMEEDLFPGDRSLRENRLEEERRLCYVAITRAREKLYFTHARRRILFGREIRSEPSRFLAELPQEGVTRRSSSGLKNDAGQADVFGRGFGAAGSGERDWRRQGAKLISRNPGRFAVGDRVEHARLGPGIVLSVRGTEDETFVKIVFRTEVKEVIAGSANLKKKE
jgi:DNA helicase-2/ATP-dependent DNA helicase PcrA